MTTNEVIKLLLNKQTEIDNKINEVINMDVLGKVIYVVYGNETFFYDETEEIVEQKVIKKVFRNEENAIKYCKEHKNKQCNYEVWILND